MDEAVADDADDPRPQSTDDDAHRHRYRLDHAVQRFAGEDDVGGEETDVHHPGDHHHQQCAEGAELGPALDHLRNAHLRALGRVQCHQYPAEQMPDEDRDDAPYQVQVEQLHAQRAGNDGQRGDVAAEPQGEQIPYLSMAVFRWHIADRVFFDEGCRIGCTGHD
ncbi:hypothetical protein D3C79_904740 [compost metagenome]